MSVEVLRVRVLLHGAAGGRERVSVTADMNRVCVGGRRAEEWGGLAGPNQSVKCTGKGEARPILGMHH